MNIKVKVNAEDLLLFQIHDSGIWLWIRDIFIGHSALLPSGGLKAENISQVLQKGKYISRNKLSIYRRIQELGHWETGVKISDHLPLLKHSLGGKAVCNCKLLIWVLQKKKKKQFLTLWVVTQHIELLKVVIFPFHWIIQSPVRLDWFKCNVFRSRKWS